MKSTLKCIALEKGRDVSDRKIVFQVPFCLFGWVTEAGMSESKKNKPTASQWVKALWACFGGISLIKTPTFAFNELKFLEKNPWKLIVGSSVFLYSFCTSYVYYEVIFRPDVGYY